MDFDLELWHLVVLGPISALVGLVGGMTGLALGTLRLPFLVALGVPPALAAGTNIGVSALGALGGSVRHIQERRVIPRLVVVVGVPSVVGAFLGGYYGGLVSDGLILLAVAGLIAWSGGSMLYQVRRRVAVATSGVEKEERRPSFDAVRVGAEMAVGGGIGLLGGAVGLVLGTLRLPAMIQILRIGAHRAAGTNLVVGFAVGVFGFGGHLLRDEVNFATWVVMGIAALAGSYVGARQTGRLSDRSLRLAIGAILSVMSVIMLYQAVREL